MEFLRGTVYSKALAIFLAAALGLLGTVAALTQLIILREFDRSEEREMKAMLQRFSAVMARDLVPQQAALQEWAGSGALAGLFVDPAGSPQNFFSPAVLKSLDVDFLAVVDRAGGIVHLVLREPGMESELRLRLDPSLFRAWEKSAGLPTGYILVNGELFAVSAAGIPPDGPLEFFLAAGRRLDKTGWGFLEGLFSASIRFQTLGNVTINETTGSQLLTLLSRDEVVVAPVDSGQIAGYRLVKGLDGKPLGYFSISQPRPLRQEGLRAIQIFLTGICLAGGALVLVVWFLLDRTILARIKKLTRKLEDEKQSGRLPVKLDFPGDDELGTLARGIEDLAVLLERTQSLHRSVLEDQTELICRFDPEFRLTFANAIFLKVFQIPEPALSRSLRDLLPHSAWQELTEHFERLAPDTPPANYTAEVRLGKAAPSWFRCTVRKNYSPEGTFSGGQWVLTDITALVEAQRKVIESERRFRRLFETASEGLLLVEGPSLLISDVSPSLCRMLMVSGPEILGRRLDALALFAPCVEVVRAFLAKGTERGAPTECQLLRGDETSVFAELRCGRYDVDGTAFVQLSFRNISERVLGERELRRLSAQLLRLQDEERRRIARELHDSTAQNLSALEMNMSLLEPLVERTNPSATHLVSETRQIASECSKELRNIAYLLHPPLIDEVGLAFAINWFADGFSKRTGIVTHVEIEKELPRLGSDVEMPLFRVVQEAMTNIYRHSGADHAWVRLQIQDRILTMEIRDNGRGFRENALLKDEPEKGGGLGVGLAGMKERLIHVGGTLEIESSPLGATLTIRVPLQVKEFVGSPG